MRTRRAPIPTAIAARKEAVQAAPHKAPVLHLVRCDAVKPPCTASLDLLQQARAELLSGAARGVMLVTLGADGSYNVVSADGLYNNNKVLCNVAQWLLGKVLSDGMRKGL